MLLLASGLKAFQLVIILTILVAIPCFIAYKFLRVIYKILKNKADQGEANKTKE